MHLLDTSVWVALALSTHMHHVSAVEWFAPQSQAASILFCRATQHAFLRLITTESVVRLYETGAMTNALAWQVYGGYLADPRVAWSDEPPGVEAQWKKFALHSTASPKLWMDAYLAAFAMEGKHQLVTFDRAFKQFKGLDVLVLGTARTT